MTSKSKPCKGTYYNGPGKRYARCRVCGHIDWEANEGDRCRRLVPEVIVRRAMPEGVAVLDDGNGNRVVITNLPKR